MRNTIIMSNKSPVFIIDGSSFLYRDYYGIRPLQTTQGVSVQAVYSFCRMIRKLIKDFKIKHIVIVWDSKGKNIRHEIFPEYKTNRQQAPLDLFEQKELILTTKARDWRALAKIFLYKDPSHDTARPGLARTGKKNYY